MNWWNKLATMTDLEIKALPLHIQKKYLSIIHKIDEFEKQLHMEYKAKDPRYQQHYDLNDLVTNEEKRLKQARIEELRIHKDTFDFEQPNYMSRQPRVDLSKNYNFE